MGNSWLWAVTLQRQAGSAKLVGRFCCQCTGTCVTQRRGLKIRLCALHELMKVGGDLLEDAPCKLTSGEKEESSQRVEKEVS